MTTVTTTNEQCEYQRKMIWWGGSANKPTRMLRHSSALNSLIGSFAFCFKWNVLFVCVLCELEYVWVSLFAPTMRIVLKPDLSMACVRTVLDTFSCCFSKKDGRHRHHVKSSFKNIHTKRKIRMHLINNISS